MALATLLSAALLAGCSTETKIVAGGVTDPVIDPPRWTVEGEEHVETHDFTETAAGLAQLHATTVNGGLRLTGTQRTDVSVEAEVRVRAPTLAQARDVAATVVVHVERDADRLLVTRTYPQPASNVQVNVTYRIETPSHLVADLSTMNGGIEVRDMAEAVRAETMNGGIDADLSLLGDASSYATTNGSIEIDVAGGCESLTATTTNGGIEVRLPSDFTGRFDGSTSNGRVRSEFPMDGARGDAKRLTGPLGSGGESVVHLRTVNGDIELQRQ
jgi:hypothetical protein